MNEIEKSLAAVYALGGDDDEDFKSFMDALSAIPVGWHGHTDELHRDEYGRSSFHTHDGIKPHQHQPDGSIVYHYTIPAPRTDESSGT